MFDAGAHGKRLAWASRLPVLGFPLLRGSLDLPEPYRRWGAHDGGRPGLVENRLAPRTRCAPAREPRCRKAGSVRHREDMGGIWAGSSIRRPASPGAMGPMRGACCCCGQSCASVPDRAPAAVVGDQGAAYGRGEGRQLPPTARYVPLES